MRRTSRRELLRYSLAILAVAFGTVASLTAQLDRATLTGTITDSTGAIVPNAVVSILSGETGLKRSTQTNDTGGYTFPQLPIGVYEIGVQHPGMRPVTTKDVRLGVG